VLTKSAKVGIKRNEWKGERKEARKEGAHKKCKEVGIKGIEGKRERKRERERERKGKMRLAHELWLGRDQWRAKSVMDFK
jgi:hypothetical protein